MTYIGFWRRFAALLIDIIILAIIGGVIGLIFSWGGFSRFQVGLINNVVNLVLAIGYWVFYQAKMGQTLGKKALGIKVVTTRGKTPSTGNFFLREIVGKFVSGLILGIGYLMVIWDSKKQGLHDKIASTYVVKA